jgi:hypothetical protein
VAGADLRGQIEKEERDLAVRPRHGCHCLRLRYSVSTPTDVLETLARLGADPENAVYLQAPATEAAIESLQSDARRDRGDAVPESYIRLLRLTDRRGRGFQIINMGYPDEQLESFATFEELLRRVFEEQQVL